MRYQPKENRCDTSESREHRLGEVSLKKTNPKNRVLVPLVEYSPFTSYYPTIGVVSNNILVLYREIQKSFALLFF